MPEQENKVQLNIKNTHYAVLTDGTKPTWGPPVPIPGTVKLNLKHNGEVSKFYADGVVYYQSASDNGYDGTMEIAKIPEQMLKDVWGFEEADTDFVLMEKLGIEAKPFALLFQIDGDQNNDFYLYYNCAANKPSVNAETSKETKTPTTQELEFSAAGLKDGRISARTTSKTTEGVKTAWFTKVWEKTA